MPEEMPILAPELMAPSSPHPPTWQNIARKQVKQWIASTGITQTQVCAAIGRNQPWLSRYLAGGIDADLDTLASIAKVFDHSLFALLSVPADPDEALLIGLYRAVNPEARKHVLALLRELNRGRSPGRSRS